MEWKKVQSVGRWQYPLFLLFNISIQQDNFNSYYKERDYSVQQEELYKQIWSLKNEGLSYRKISKYLNDKGILTPNKKDWGLTVNSVYSILTRYKKR